MKFISEEEILKLQTPGGGWTRETLEGWGVPWPPPQGWKEHILRYGIPYDGIEDLHGELDKECDNARDRDRK
jgi:hypothetical protein